MEAVAYHRQREQTVTTIQDKHGQRNQLKDNQLDPCLSPLYLMEGLQPLLEAQGQQEFAASSCQNPGSGQSKHSGSQRSKMQGTSEMQNYHWIFYSVNMSLVQPLMPLQASS
ncbi:hypothetical protein STEG23_023054 [Scotinomys teguina]